MRVNVYAEEMTDRVEIIAKEIDGTKFTGLRFYLYLPATVPMVDGEGKSKTMQATPRLSRSGARRIFERFSSRHQKGSGRKEPVVRTGCDDVRTGNFGEGEGAWWTR